MGLDPKLRKDKEWEEIKQRDKCSVCDGSLSFPKGAKGACVCNK